MLEFTFAKLGHKVENLEEELINNIERYAKVFQVETEKTSLSTRFTTLVEKISEK